MRDTCASVGPLLSAALDGELTGPARARLSAHLAACEACSALRTELVRPGAALRALVDERLARLDLTPLADGVMARVRREERPLTRVERVRAAISGQVRAHRFGVGAGVGLMAAAGLLFSVQHLPTRAAAPAAEQPQLANIEDLEMDQGGAVLQAGQTTVIWVSDEPAGGGAR